MSNVRDHQRTQPAIRFKGFTDAWEKSTFYDSIIKIQTGTNLLGDQDNIGIPLLKMGNLQRGYFTLDKLERLDGEAEPENLVKQGDFLFNTRNTLELVGKGATWMGKSGVIAFNSNIARFSFKDINTVFFNYLYNTSQLLAQVHSRAVGTTSVAAVYPKDLMSVFFFLPSIQEQEQIGDLLSQLDNLIAVNQRKGDVLQNLKKGLLQRLFASETSPIPDIRFKGFTDAWEKRKLGEVATITMGQSPDSKNYTLNPQDHILVQGNADIKNGWVEPRVWTTQITKIAKKGSVLLSVRAPVGEVSKTAFDVVLGRGVASVGQTDFLYQYLITLKINGFWLRYSTGSTFDSINSADIKDAIIFLPEKNEQSRIAKTLNCIDNLIAATQRKGEVLKNLKKALLQKMFV